MFISLLVPMTSCWMIFFMNRAALEDKQVRLIHCLLCIFLSGLNYFMKLSYGLLSTLTLNNSLISGTLSSIPTALTRWTDECKVLDAESMHDCVAGMLTFGYCI